MAAAAAYVFSRDGATWSEDQKLVPDDPAPGDLFGVAVAVSEDTIVVGAPGQGAGAGAAYVFILEDGAWIQDQKLVASDGTAGDHFGATIAISYDTIVVGAVDDDDQGLYAGSAYVFFRSGDAWVEQQKLLPRGAAEESWIGSSVAAWDGRALVGARKYDHDGKDSGGAFVFPTFGDTCGSAYDCPSGFCADGVCCNRACDGACEACTAALTGSGVDGVCGAVPAERDAGGECVAGDARTDEDLTTFYGCSVPAAGRRGPTRAGGPAEAFTLLIAAWGLLRRAFPGGAAR